MQNITKISGSDGEEKARGYLRKEGYEILEVNWRFRKLEVDIICRKDNTIVFVEVKTRKNGTFGEPEVFVTRKKQGFLVAAAQQYLTENDIGDEARFDIVAIVRPENGPYEVRHLESAFYPSIKK